MRRARYCRPSALVPAVLVVGLAAAVAGAAEIDLSTEIVSAPAAAEPGDTVRFTVEYRNTSGTDAEDTRVRLILPAGAFYGDWSTQDYDDVAASVSDSLGHVGDAELDPQSCDNVLVSITGQQGAPPMVPAGAAGQFSVDIPLPAQMPTIGVFRVDAPQSLAGIYDFTVGRCDVCGAPGTCFGGPLSQKAAVSAELELVNDPAGGEPTEGCGELDGFTAGNIALVRRGTCGFGVKALNAENAGAVGVVIIDNTPASNVRSLTMAGGSEGGDVDIPVVLISFEDGEALIDELETKAPVTATLGGVAIEELPFVSTAFHAPGTDTDAAGLDDTDQVITIVDYIKDEPPEVYFDFSPALPGKGQAVQFTDESLNEPTEWSWDFGDGVGASDEQNPQYAYQQAGTYTVTLTAGNQFGSADGSAEIVVSELIVADNNYFVPTAGFAEGAEGSFFVTDVEVNNSGVETMNYQFVFIPRRGTVADLVASPAFMLAPGKSARYENILGDVLGLTDALGAVTVNTDRPTARVMSRTYNRPAAKVAGTYGQSMPGFAEDDMIPYGVTRRIMFMSENDDTRSNIGCQSGVAADIRIIADVHSADGVLLESRPIDLRPFSNNQVNRIFADYEPIDVGYVDVSVTNPGGTFMCFGSVLDNLTSDPTTVLPQ